MKKINIILIVIFCALIYSNCTEEVLVEETKGIMAPEGFFETPADVKAAVHGAYAEWTHIDLTEKGYVLAKMLRSDMVDIGDRNTKTARININDFQEDPYNSIVSGAWRRLYLCISAANNAIRGARGISADKDIKDKLEAQARFIRAFTYYNLVRTWGPVPYIESPIESEEEFKGISRTSEDKIYEEIIEDLKFAKTNLPPQNPDGVTNIGTEGSAATMLAEVYLTLKRFSEASSEARYVINNKDKFNYGLAKDYQDLFNANVINSLNEPIFTVDEKNDLHDGGYNPLNGMINLTRIRDLAPRSLSVAVPSLKVYESWDERDYRKEVSFEDTVTIDGERKAVVDLDIRVPRPHIAKWFRYPGPQEGGDDRCGDHHWSYYRYADLLLIAAEAIAESEGATSEAIGYVNQIRERARFNGVEETDFPKDVNAGINDENFIQLIREERKWEFAFEYRRWFDIKRWDILEEVFTQPGSLEPHPNIDPDKHYLFPIPQNEINTSDISQNPGY